MKERLLAIKSSDFMILYVFSLFLVNYQGLYKPEIGEHQLLACFFIFPLSGGKETIQRIKIPWSRV